MVHELDMTVPRGATKDDVAQLVAERVRRTAEYGQEVENVPVDAPVVLRGELYWSGGPTSKRHELKLYSDGQRYVLNAALRGPATLFKKLPTGETESVGAHDKAYWGQP